MTANRHGVTDFLTICYMFGHDKEAPKPLTSYETIPFIYKTVIQLFLVHLIEQNILAINVTNLHLIYHNVVV